MTSAKAEQIFAIEQDKQEASSDRHMFILLDALSQCNLRCVMCGHSSQANLPSQVIDRNSFENIAETLFPLSRQVNLSCGYEPFIFEGIFDYIGIAVKHHIPKLTLTTNALLLNRAKIERLVALGLPQISISADGATKEMYESIRLGGQFGKFMENLRHLKAVKDENHQETPKIQFNFVLMEKNLHEVSSFIRMMSEFKPYKFVFVHLDHKPPSAALRLKIELTLKQALAACASHQMLFEEVPSYCLTFKEILLAYGCNPEGMTQIVHQCGDPWHFMRIAPDGDVFMCPHISEAAGNIFRAGILDIWDGDIYSKLRNQLRTGIPPVDCQSCPYSNMGLVQIRQLQDTMEHLIRRQISSQ